MRDQPPELHLTSSLVKRFGSRGSQDFQDATAEEEGEFDEEEGEYDG